MTTAPKPATAPASRNVSAQTTVPISQPPPQLQPQPQPPPAIRETQVPVREPIVPAMQQAPPPTIREPQQSYQQPTNQLKPRASNITSSIPDKAPQLPSPVPQKAPYNYQQQQPRQQKSNPAFRGPSTQVPQYQAAAAAAAMQNGGYGGSYTKAPGYSSPVQQGSYSRGPANGTYAHQERQVAPGPAQQARAQAPPARRVFGQTLDALFKRDELPVPLVVSQCIQAVDLFGLQVEGIYRLSGNAVHISQLKQVFDTDASRVDFRNPEHFHHDVNSVAGLLKQFFRELPDPLLTAEFYNEFIEAARMFRHLITS
jgi:hypothetical protein